LQVTFWPDPAEPDLSTWVLERALADRDRQPRSRRRRITYINGCGDGDTVYIGSRSSEQMGRFYDKEKESGAAYYTGAWRAEVEYHNDHATTIAKKIAASKDPAGKIYATVAAWYSARGCELLNHNPGDVIRFTPAPHVTGDDLHRLQWLATTVSPSVRRLVDAVGFDIVTQALYDGDSFLESVGILKGLPQIRGTQHGQKR